MLFAGTACFHAVVDTGLAPSNTKIEQQWASGWIFGLVPPNPIEAKSKCSGGVSKVETLHSVPNYIVQFVTLGIYTPMTITVTCAQGGHSAIPSGSPTVEVGANATAEQVQLAFDRAVRLSIERGGPVYLEY